MKTYDRIFNTIKKRRGLVAALPDDNSKDRDKHAYLKAVKSFVGKQKEKRKAKSHGAATTTYVKDRPTSPRGKGAATEGRGDCLGVCAEAEFS